MGFYRDGVWQPDATEIASGEFERVGVYATGVTCKAKLTAANERIRKLETAFNELMGRVSEMVAEDTAEREVSDKLEKALYRFTNYPGAITESDFKNGNAVLAEVAALRATHTNREQAD